MHKWIDPVKIESDETVLLSYTGDCVSVMKQFGDETFDVVVTSPPYNLDISYATYKDKLSHEDYLAWTDEWIGEVSRVLRPEGSFFLNVSGSPSRPAIPDDVCLVGRGHLTLQNRIVWVKSITIEGKTSGHFKPINSKRFLNDTHEFIYHFTKTGDVALDRLAVGVEYADKSNVKRWKHAGSDVRCRGNTWFLPYETVQSKAEKWHHPATFPVSLPEQCVRLHGLPRVTNVLDPFGGVGSTAVACKRLGVDCVLIDIDSDYNKISQKRFTHEKCTVFRVAD